MVLERNRDYWGDKVVPVSMGGSDSVHPTLSQSVRKDGAPDLSGRLGLRWEDVEEISSEYGLKWCQIRLRQRWSCKKGSADVASNVVTPDMVHALEGERGLKVERGPGSVVVYANFNVNDPVLKDRRVRQAMACAMDRQAIVDSIWRGQAKLAQTLLPAGHWAAASPADMASYPHDVERAKRLLDEAGFHAGADGVRVRITLKTSTDETTRLLAQAMQQQVRGGGYRSADTVGGVWDVLCGRDEGGVSDVCAALDWEQ